MNKPTSPHPYPPGHEALGSLVDVASKLPSLPIPRTHTSSPSNVVSQHKDEKQRLIIQEGLGDRFSRETMPQERCVLILLDSKLLVLVNKHTNYCFICRKKTDLLMRLI